MCGKAILYYPPLRRLVKYPKLADFEDLVPHVKAGADLTGDELLEASLKNGDRNMVTVRHDFKRRREQLDSTVTGDPRKIYFVIVTAEVTAQDLVRTLDGA